MQEVKFAPGDVIYREGENADAIYVLEVGDVEVSRKVKGRPVQLGILGKGEIFGESGVIQDKPRSTTMTALTEISALRLSKDKFLAAFGENNPIGLPLLRMLCARLAKVDEKMLATRTEKHVPARLIEVAAIRILPGSDLMVRQIGHDGVLVGELPFRVGRRQVHDQPTAVSANALHVHMTSDHSISPDHFALEKRDGILIVRDLGSYLGTIVNHRALSRFGQSATQELIFGANDVIAGTKESPYCFRVVVEKTGKPNS